MHAQFSVELHTKMLAKIKLAIRERPKPWIAAFDADGTLWDTDVGEEFFEYQIQNKLVQLPPNPWQVYKDKKQVNACEGLMWLAQINAGKKESQVRDWATQCVRESKTIKALAAQKMLIDELRALGVEIYVVTASAKWAVEPAALLYGVDADHVLGMITVVKDGVVTAEPILPYTWVEGKPKALIAKTGAAPILAAGNTMGDIHLLQSATHVALAVKSHGPAEPLFQTESELQREAKNRGWFYHQFR